jgi:hypothetical protein
MFKQHKHCMYNVTLGHDRTTIGEVEKQKVLHCVCVCVFVYLGNQHAMHMSSLTCPVLQYFPTLSHTRHNFLTKSYWTQDVFWFSIQLLSATFHDLRRTEWDKIKKMYIGLHVIRFQCNLILLHRPSKNTQVSDLMKTHPVGSEVLHVDGQTW